LFNQIVSQKDSNGEPNYKANFLRSVTSGKNIDNSTQIITKMGCVLVNCIHEYMVSSFFMECNYKTGNITRQETYALVPKTPVFGLTQEQKDTLLNLHRQARAAVNASNMKELNWSDELANIAQVIFFKKIFFFIKYNNRTIIEIYNCLLNFIIFLFISIFF